MKINNGKWMNTVGNDGWFEGMAFQYRAVHNGWEAVCAVPGGWRWELHSTISGAPREGLVAEGIEPTKERALAVMKALQVLTPEILHEQG